MDPLYPPCLCDRRPRRGSRGGGARGPWPPPPTQNIAPPSSQARIQGGPRGPCPPPPLQNPGSAYEAYIPIRSRAVARPQKWRRRNLLAYPEYPHGHCVFPHSRIFAFLPQNQRRRPPPLPQPGYGPDKADLRITIIEAMECMEDNTPGLPSNNIESIL